MCLRSTFLPGFTLEQQLAAADAAGARVQGIHDRLETLQVEHNFAVQDLGRQVQTYRSVDQEFHRVFGITLNDWVS